MKNSSLVLIMTAAFLALTAQANDRGQQRNGACKEDVKRLCAGVKPGEGRIKRCMMEKKSQVSAECKQNAMAKFHQKAGACSEDIKKFCAGVTPGNGAIKQCMRSNKELISTACKEQIKQKRQARKGKKKNYVQI